MDIGNGSTVRVYVRKGADSNERRISFKIPETIPPIDLLKRRVAIDGNEAAFTIWAKFDHQAGYMDDNTNDWVSTGEWTFGGPFYDQAEEQAATLTDALAIAQCGLYELLTDHNHRVEFA